MVAGIGAKRGGADSLQQFEELVVIQPKKWAMIRWAEVRYGRAAVRAALTRGF
jgi:hypothetical protein